MGYMHIDPLYKCVEFFRLFQEVYIMEKIHGTTTWIIFNNINKTINFHSGGSDGNEFKAIFDEKNLTSCLSDMPFTLVKIHGEGYGGKMQAMSHTYGPTLKFVAFDVYVENEQTKSFLNVDEAEKLCHALGLEFVHYIRANNIPEIIEEESVKESVQAIRNGMGPGKQREGVIVKPIIESYLRTGKRAVFKHKNEIFWEIKTKRSLGEKLKVASDINEIVDDWVRLHLKMEANPLYSFRV